MGGVNKRSLEVGSDTCLLGFSGREYIKSAVFDATTLAPVGGVNEVQTVTVNGIPTGGTFKLKYRGQTTGTIAFNAAGSVVQTALRALSNIGATGVTVTGAGPYVVTFGGPLAAQDVFMLQADSSGLTGGTLPTVTIAQTTQGVTLDPRILVGSPTKPGTLVAKTGTTPNKVREYTGLGGVAEIQTLTVTGTPTGGTLKLFYKGETAVIAFNSTSGQAQTQLDALAELSVDGGVVVSGGALPGTPLVFTFKELGARQSFVVDNAGLTGGASPAGAIVETLAGVDPEAIWGIVDGVEEFIGNTSTADRDMAVYVTRLVVNTNKLKNYATFKAAVDRWAAANFNRLEAV